MSSLTRTSTKRVSITRTEGEWRAIADKIIELGKPDLNCYLRSKIYQLCRQLDECPNLISPAEGEKIQRQHYISVATYEKLEVLSIRMGRPIGCIVDEMIIAPLLSGNGQ